MTRKRSPVLGSVCLSLFVAALLVTTIGVGMGFGLLLSVLVGHPGPVLVPAIVTGGGSLVAGISVVVGSWADEEVPGWTTAAARHAAALVRTAQLEREAGLRFDGIFMLPGYYEED